MGETVWKPDIGADVGDNGGTRFRVWAPKAGAVSVRLASGSAGKDHPLQPEGNGFFSGTAGGVTHGNRYFYLLDGTTERPDPASRFQPDGVHGASQVVDPSLFRWQDHDWTGIPLKQYVMYELHVGTFTRDGTFDAVIPRLDYLKDLGITAIELMPVTQFPGTRNWGYDGAYPFAPQNSYGGPDGLKRLVDACHRKGMAVVLDVVYNHLGPEGNYFRDFGFYFTDHYRTPWGEAINYDGRYSDPVRAFVIANALYWLTEFHMDALRLDAIHEIYDFSARHILQEMADEVNSLNSRSGRETFLIAESNLNDPRIIHPPEIGGHGMHAQWNDDFHHSLHTLLTGDREGYYEDFGRFNQLEKACREGFVYTGQYSSFRKRRHGSVLREPPFSRLAVFVQNHDQVGNTLRGERLAATLPLPRLLLAAGISILSPFLPLIFMGEEYGETAPFPYFVSHSDPSLVEAVRKGRKEEFSGFGWNEDPPDPQDEATFKSARINPARRTEGPHRAIFAFYKRLLELRRSLPPLAAFDPEGIEVTGLETEKVLCMGRYAGESVVFSFFSFNDRERNVLLPFAAGKWEKLLDSAAAEWGGEGEAAETVVTATGNGAALAIKPFTMAVYRKI